MAGGEGSVLGAVVGAIIVIANRLKMRYHTSDT